MNRDEFYAAMARHDDARLRKILWTVYWRGNVQLRERIEDELRPQDQPKVKPKKELPDPAGVLDEVTTFVELAKDGAPNSASPPRSANACHSRGQGIPAGLVATEPARPARFAPGPSRKTLMTVTSRPHRVAMSSGSDVRTVTGPGAAKAVALSIASIACR